MLLSLTRYLILSGNMTIKTSDMIVFDVKTRPEACHRQQTETLR